MVHVSFARGHEAVVLTDEHQPVHHVGTAHQELACRLWHAAGARARAANAACISSTQQPAEVLEPWAGRRTAIGCCSCCILWQCNVNRSPDSQTGQSPYRPVQSKDTEVHTAHEMEQPTILKVMRTLVPRMQDTSTMVRWESLFSTATAATDITIPTGTPVVLHGCAQFNSTVSVRSITIPVGATVSFSTAAAAAAPCDECCRPCLGCCI